MRDVLARLDVPADAIDEIVDGGPQFDDLRRVVARLPEALERHRALGTDDVFWATMTDIGTMVRRHKLEHGVYGMDAAWWLEHHLAGRLVRLGALQFERLDGGVLGVHITEGGPLDPASCDDSFEQARRRLDPTTFRCSSWLLDDQLAEYLPATSNIIRFQRRFTPTGESAPGDEDILKFVFHRVGTTSREGLPRTTTLERAVLDHLDAGRHWRVVVGSFSASAR